MMKSRQRNRKTMVLAASAIMIKDFFSITLVENGALLSESRVCWMILGIISCTQSTAIKTIMPDTIDGACLRR